MVGSRAGQALQNHRLNPTFDSSAPANGHLRLLPACQTLCEGQLQVLRTRPAELADRLDSLSNLLYWRWGSKDAHPSRDLYRDQLFLRSIHASTPAFLAVHDGAIRGAIFPLRVNALLPTWDALTDRGTWSTDTPEGRILVCPQICVYDTRLPDGSKLPIARALIVESVLPYARALYEAGEIERLVAYSRPSNFASAAATMPISHYVHGVMDGSIHDAALSMHKHYGAVPAEIFPNGCPQDSQSGGYIVAMDYTHLLSKK
ncbi:MAG: hypothetical protein KGH63_00550 [Candidatus Micrarchaeota archaeon]|nr:hypothetical protein [Candidatus Micrarchaeota archaeon]